MVCQYAGVDKWEAEIKRQEQLLHTRKWKGQNNFSLESFVSQHRNAFVSMQQCSQHVTYQLPNKHSRVGYLLEAIQCQDAGLQAAMASIRTNDDVNGKRNDFEKAVAHLLPYDPVAKQRATIGSKRPVTNISLVDGEEAEDTNTAEVGSADTKPSIGKTGVHLRYYKTKEYHKLTNEQKLELKKWGESLPANKRGDSKASDAKRQKRQIKQQVASLVKKEISAEVKKTKFADEEDPEAKALVAADGLSKYVASLGTSEGEKKPAASAGKTALRSIFRNARNESK